MVHALRGEFAAAAPLVRASLDVQPSRPGVWRNYALVLDRLGRRAEAVDAWSRAVESASPRLPASHAWRQSLAAAQAAAGESEAAIAALVRACEEHPGDPRMRWNLARVALAGAEFKRAAGRAGDAARLAALALEGGALGADESFRAGLLLADGGDMPGAARAFERARAQDAGIFARQRAQAVAMLDAGRHAAAAAILAGLVAADPTDAAARRELGRARLTGAPGR
jgi:tetratricopeptide (TPR) repeat protein